MSIDPVVETVHGTRITRRCAVADVVRTQATSERAALLTARALLDLLPGLALVTVDLPGNRVAVVSAEGHLGTVPHHPGLIEEVYASHVARPRLPLPRAGESAATG
jgi:hypothetical protein